MKYEFFLPIKIPIQDAKKEFLLNLSRHKPEKPAEGAVMLKTTWFYEPAGTHKAGEFKTTKPDTDNYLFKDCMKAVGFWKSNAQVAVELTEKLYGSRPGVFVEVREIGKRCGVHVLVREVKE